MGEGNGNGKTPVIGCGMSVFQKNYSWRTGSFLVYDPTFHHLFLKILDPDVFSGSGIFRNPAENFAGLRSGPAFSLKEDPGIYLDPRSTTPTDRQIWQPHGSWTYMLLVAMPFVTSSFLLLVKRPGATSSFLLLVAMPFAPSSLTPLCVVAVCLLQCVAATPCTLGLSERRVGVNSQPFTF